MTPPASRASARAPSRRWRALAVLLVLLSAAFAGCAEEERVDPEVARAVANTQAMTWSPGNHWDYHAVYRQNRTFDVTLVMHEAHADGFHLGSNSSAGFFGLPFTGNVTQELNPVIGSEVWPMFSFPLSDGKSWAYTLFGYDAKSTARAALVDVPGHGKVPGFRIEATAYGQTFARYDYTSLTGWFTRLELIEPTDQTVVLDVSMRGFGTDFSGDYSYERTLKKIRLEFPGLPKQSTMLAIPEGYQQVRAHLSVQSTAGAIESVLKDSSDRQIAGARVVAKGTASESVSPRSLGTWTLEATGAGVGFAYLEVTGLTAIGVAPARPAAWDQDDPFSLAGLLQSTRPDRPQTGHETSTGAPVAV